MYGMGIKIHHDAPVWRLPSQVPGSSQSSWLSQAFGPWRRTPGPTIAAASATAAAGAAAALTVVEPECRWPSGTLAFLSIHGALGAPCQSRCPGGAVT